MDNIDPILAVGYSELRRETINEPDWNQMRRAIAKRADPLLRHRRANKFVRMARPVMPLALAASVAFSLWIGPSVLADFMADGSTEFSTSLTSEDGLVKVLDGNVTDQEALRLVTGRANPDEWLAFAINEQ
jgi:hypothetical protein